MRAIVIKECCRMINDYNYKEGDEIEVTELISFPSDYAIYYKGTMDWIPKDSVKIIEL